VRRWFDRSFVLGLPHTAAPRLFDRLRSAADRLQQALLGTPVPVRIHRRDGRWSIQEHAGHLLDLEPLGELRLNDFEAGAAVLHPADVENRKTHDARHNERDGSEIAAGFRAARSALVARLENMRAADLSRVALHPRLQQPMSVVDFCFFIAEHDDHHLAAIAELSDSLSAFPLYALDLVNTVEGAAAGLAAMDGTRTTSRPAQGKWSPREILGHLVDSASANHQRFVRAMFQDDLVFAGYEQANWVAAQRYQDAPWAELVTLWCAFNRHLARVMAGVPDAIRSKPRTRHSLDRIAFRPVRADTPATLEYLMQDYVDHLRHHLTQLQVYVPPR
jgi:hypothetical protein